MITDGEHSVALAAIMGGEESEVSEGTNEVLLEAANFEPLGILRTSERLGPDSRFQPLGEGRRPVPRGERGGPREPDDRRSRGRADDRTRRRPRRASRTARRPSSPRAGVVRDRARRCPGRAAHHPRGLRFRGLERLGRHRADLARARCDTRDRRDRGGRASSARPDPAHDAASPTCARAPLESAAAPSRRRRRPRRRGRLRGVHLEPRWVGSEPRRDSPSESDDVRPRGPSDDDRSRARRGGPHRCRRGRPRRRALRDRTRLSAV